MKDPRKRVLAATALWTLLLLALAAVIAGEAISSLNGRQQACFFNFPAIACPAGDDPAVARLTFAFFGVPTIWLLGIVVGAVALAIRRSSGARWPAWPYPYSINTSCRSHGEMRPAGHLHRASFATRRSPGWQTLTSASAP